LEALDPVDADLTPPPKPEFDPYAAPKASLDRVAEGAGSEDLARAEAIRRAHLTHEASVQSIGSLHYISVIFGVLGFVLILFGALSMNAQVAGGVQGAQLVGTLVYLLAVTALNLAMAIGLTRLKPWARWTEVVLTCLSIIYLLVVMVGVSRAPAAAGPGLGFFLGTFLAMMIIPGYILYLLLSPKASTVFSSGYREIIERTPHIKYKTSWLVKGCLILFLLLIVFAVLVALLAPRR
jgi:hypothetical protein